MNAQYHGHIEYSDVTYRVNTTARLICDDGYQISGNVTFTCIKENEKNYWHPYGRNASRCIGMCGLNSVACFH